MPSLSASVGIASQRFFARGDRWLHHGTLLIDADLGRLAHYLTVPPAKKARPWRALIVVSSTLSGFLLAVLYALLLAWWQRNHASLAHRLKTAGADPAPPVESPTG